VTNHSATARNEATIPSEAFSVPECVNHILGKLDRAAAATEPFRHLFIEGIFPAEIYSAIRAHTPTHPRDYPAATSSG
jgi:hypothetical protein